MTTGPEDIVLRNIDYSLREIASLRGDIETCQRFGRSDEVMGEKYAQLRDFARERAFRSAEWARVFARRAHQGPEALRQHNRNWTGDTLQHARFYLGIAQECQQRLDNYFLNGTYDLS